jgi:ClpP class serine protease
MNPKTNFSFEVQYTAGSAETGPDGVMASLGPSLQKVFATTDPSATVAVSDSHKGDGNKLIELTTTLQDAEIASILQAFSGQHGVTVSALE